MIDDLQPHVVIYAITGSYLLRIYPVYETMIEDSEDVPQPASEYFASPDLSLIVERARRHIVNIEAVDSIDEDANRDRDIAHREPHQT